VRLTLYTLIIKQPTTLQTGRYITLQNVNGANISQGSVATTLRCGGILKSKLLLIYCWVRQWNNSDMTDRGPQGRDNRARSAINLRPEDGYLQLVCYKKIMRF